MLGNLHIGVAAQAATGWKKRIAGALLGSPRVLRGNPRAEGIRIGRDSAERAPCRGRRAQPSPIPNISASNYRLVAPWVVCGVIGDGLVHVW